MLENYKKEQNILLNQYDKLVKMENLFPIKYGSEKPITIDDIKEKQLQLKNQHFFVSFTGQIKAGKSTLINALIFKDNILPADDTPHTAKITILKYAKTPKIEVTFYNKLEWNEIRKNEYFEQYILPEVENAMQKGIFPNEIIQENAYIQNDSIENLKEYVAKEGKYTPFVNLVTVYYPSEILKDITIVDTPGTNDPNPIRDKVAKEWIKKTDANVYIIYAGQAFSDEDMEFLDKYLVTIPKNQKLTVINKIDSVDNVDNLKSWLKELSKGILKNKEIYLKDEDIILVSALGALIDELLNEGKELDEELEYYANILDEKGFLEPNKHNLSHLKQAIENKLIENKGANILSSHRTYIKSLFEIKLKNLNDFIEEEKSHIIDLLQDKEEITKNIEVLNSLIDKFDTEMEQIDNFLKIKKRDQENELYAELSEYFNEINQQINMEIEAIQIPSTFSFNKKNTMINSMNELIWKIKNLFELNSRTLNNLIQETEDVIINDYINKINNLRQQMIELNKNAVNLGILNNKILLGNAKELIEISKNSVNETINYNLFEKIYSDNNARIINTSSNFENMKKQLKHKTNSELEEIKKTIENQLTSKIDKIIQNKQQDLNKKIRPFLEEKRIKLKQLQEDYSQKDTLLEEVNNKIKTYEENINIINKLKKELINGN